MNASVQKYLILSPKAPQTADQGWYVCTKGDINHDKHNNAQVACLFTTIPQTEDKVGGGWSNIKLIYRLKKEEAERAHQQLQHRVMQEKQKQQSNKVSEEEQV